MSNSNFTFGEVKSQSFQKQTIEEGSYLYSYKYSAFVKVLALVECGPELCAAFMYGEAEFLIALTAENFCSVPTYQEGVKESQQINATINAGGTRQEVSYYIGDLVQNPEFSNCMFSGSIKNIIRMVGQSDIQDKKSFFMVKVLGLEKTIKTAVPYKAFLNVFFQARRKEFDPSYLPVSAVELNQRRKYQETFRMIDGLRQNPEGLSFQEFQMKKRF